MSTHSTHPGSNQSSEKLPRRVTVAEVLEGRANPGSRALKWEKREPGIDKVRTTDGEVICLASSGQQSTPAPQWELLLTDQVRAFSQEVAYAWTLYGMKAGASQSKSALPSEGHGAN